MLEIEVRGMSCGGCARAVERAVQAVEGVRSVHVSLDQAKVSVEGDVERAALAKAIVAAGYEVVA